MVGHLQIMPYINTQEGDWKGSLLFLCLRREFTVQMSGEQENGVTMTRSGRRLTPKDLKLDAGQVAQRRLLPWLRIAFKLNAFPLWIYGHNQFTF